MKTLYNYHPVTGEFLHTSEADESPKEPGVFLIPANATDQQPPATPPKKKAVFSGSSWTLVDDFRGTVYWLNDSYHTISELRVTVPTEARDSKPAESPSVIKNNKWNAIKAERDRRIQNGGYKVGAKWFHSDTFSRTQQMGLVMMVASIPAGTPWKTMDGSTVVMTQTLAGQIFGTAAASDIAIFAAAETHKAAMEASADPAAYDFSTGWPKAFGE